VIVVNTSALIATLLREPVGDQLMQTLARTPDAMLSASAYLQARLVCRGRNGQAGLGWDW
jgi:uncharacterized protein with PIN domain